MKTEVVTLTQEAPNTYARGGVIFMAETDVQSEQPKKNSEEERERKRVERRERVRARQNTHVTIETGQPKNPEARAKEVQNRFKQRLEQLGIHDTQQSAKDLSVQLLRVQEGGHLTQEEIRKWLKDFSSLLNEPSLRDDPELRKIRRDYKKWQETLITLDPEAAEEVFAKSAFNEHLIRQFGAFLGDDVRIVYDDTPEVQKDPPTADGVVKIHVSQNPSIEVLINVARELHPNQFTNESKGNMLQYAKDLQAAARIMDAEVFSEEAIKRLYNTGVRLERMLTGREEGKEYSLQDIQDSPLPSTEDRNRIFLDLVMGRHQLTLEGNRHDFYEVYFQLWQSRNPQYGSTSLREKQLAYDAYLQEGKNQDAILRFMKPVIEKSLSGKGNLSKLTARAVESKLQQDMLQAMVGKWQRDITATEGGERLLTEALKITTGSTQERLQAINRLFQPGQKAALLEYVPAEIKELLQAGNDFNRTEAACAIATTYEKHVLEQMGFKVYTDLSGAHSTLLVIDGNTAYRVDPNGVFNENRAVNLVAVTQVGENEFGQLQGQLQYLDANHNATIRVRDAQENWHIIGGDNLVTSEYIGNLAALSGQLEVQVREMLAKKQLSLEPGEESQFIKELRFSLAKKAVDMAPDNYVAWAQMDKFATDGRGDEYMRYANFINEEGTKKAKEKGWLIGLLGTQGRISQGIEQYRDPATGNILERVYKLPEIQQLIADYESGNIDIALTALEQLISAETASDPRGHYEDIIRNVMYEIEGKIYGPPPSDVATAKKWRNLARFTLEFGIENIIGVADFAPRSDYPDRKINNLYVSGNLESIYSMSTTFDEDVEANPESIDESLYLYLSNLQRNRYAAHVVFKNINDKKGFKDGVAGYLNKDGLQFLEQRVAGIGTAQRLYEKNYAHMVASLDRWPTQKEFENIADVTLRQVIAVLPNLRDEKTGFALREWQKRRASIVGMQLSGLSQRRMTYGVLGDAPLTVPELVAGLEGEGNLTGLAGPLKMTIARYFGEPNAKVIVDDVVDSLHDQGSRGRQYGLILGDELVLNTSDTKNTQGQTIKRPKWKGLFGQSERSYAMLDTGAQDPKSMKWAAEFMFLKREDYKSLTISEGDFPQNFRDTFRQQFGAKLEGRTLTIKEYLDVHQDIAKAQLGNGTEEQIKEQFNRNIQRAIREQRLFLGALLHYGYSATNEPPFNDETRAIIWDKVAELLPSRIAAFLPKEAKNILSQSLFGGRAYDRASGEVLLNAAQFQQLNEAWNKIMQKLWIAEDQRVQDDAILLRTDIDEAQKKSLLGLNPTDSLPPQRGLEYYLSNLRLPNLADPANPIVVSATDMEIIRGITTLGKKYVGQKENGSPMDGWENGNRRGKFDGGFARMTFIFTPFLDDAPFAQWSNLTPDILGRILGGNQDAFDQAAATLTGIVANPVKKPQDLKEPFQKAIQALSDPIGLEEAQIKLEPYVSAWLDLAHETEWGKVLGIPIKLGRGKFFGLSRSKMEKHNLQANIALSEGEIADFLAGLAQDQTINDDVDKKNAQGRTMYEALRKKFKADKLATILGLLRIFTMLFGAAVGWELLKAFLPEDVGKQLG